MRIEPTVTIVRDGYSSEAKQMYKEVTSLFAIIKKLSEKQDVSANKMITSICNSVIAQKSL